MHLKIYHLISEVADCNYISFGNKKSEQTWGGGSSTFNSLVFSFDTCALFHAHITDYNAHKTQLHIVVSLHYHSLLVHSWKLQLSVMDHTSTCLPHRASTVCEDTELCLWQADASRTTCWSAGGQRNSWCWTSAGTAPPRWLWWTSRAVDINIVESYRFMGFHFDNKVGWSHNIDAL